MYGLIFRESDNAVFSCIIVHSTHAEPTVPILTNQLIN
jgi:hypothetical protein